MGEPSRRQRHRHRGIEGEGRARQGQRLSPHHPLPRRGFRRPRQGDHRRQNVHRWSTTASARPLSRLRSTACAPLGMFVSFGSASGQVEAFNINILQQKGRCSPRARRSTPMRQARGSARHRQAPVRGGRSGAVKIPVNQKYACATPPRRIAISKAAAPPAPRSWFREGRANVNEDIRR